MEQGYSTPPSFLEEISKQRARIEALESSRDARPVVHYVGASGEPAFAGAWVNFDAPGPTARPAGFYRVAGRVRLFGVIKAGTIGTTAFTLPPGFLPPELAQFAIISNGVAGVVDVQGGGAVVPTAGNSTYVFLDQVSFMVKA